MPGVDLGSASGFAKATLSSVAGLLSEFTGRDPGVWDILEGSYNGVLFHVFQSKETYSAAVGQIADSGGRRKVKYQFPYKDGQTTDDLGRKPESFNVNVVLHGNDYMRGFQKLMRELDKATPGDLVHPIRGRMRVVPEDWQITHTSEQRKAVALQITFIEHNFSVGDVRQLKDPTVKGALAKALDALKAVDRAITNIEGAVIFANNLKTSITSGLADFKAGYAKVLGRMNKSFNQGGSVDIPGLLPVNEGGNGSTGGTFPTVASPSDPFSSVPVAEISATVTAALAVEQLTKEVNQLRADIEESIATIEAGADGAGALEFYSEILGLKTSAILLQEVLETGVASSQARIIEYRVPRLMSLREAAFVNGLDVNRVSEIDLLNPDLDSTNYVPKGTVLKVPVS
jgi:hypothetical protein